jgi:hypothetical protein
MDSQGLVDLWNEIPNSIAQTNSKFLKRLVKSVSETHFKMRAEVS